MIPSYALIRDDDVSFFTCPEQFRTAHRFLLERNIPINAAVVPSVSDSASDGKGGYEPFIPPEYLGKGRYYPIGENKALTAFLKATDCIEVVQHGFSHERLENSRPEFDDDDPSRIARHMDDGATILKNTFGKAPRFFVPPYDTVSSAAMSLIRRRYEGISISRTSHHLYPMWMWPKFLWAKWFRRYMLSWNRFLVIQHMNLDVTAPGDPISVSSSILDVEIDVRDVLVLVLHSWRFFSSEGVLNRALLDRWETFLKDLISAEKIKLLKFSELGEIRRHG
jgi:peptidoglycan/xylan/chitin deacetylase (PgdA/CDA1 family)